MIVVKPYSFRVSRAPRWWLWMAALGCVVAAPSPAQETLVSTSYWDADVSGANASVGGTDRAVQRSRDVLVPLVLAASEARASFLRVVNRSDVAGEASIAATDAAGVAAATVALDLRANQVLHFNSNDLEDGNADKGLLVGVGRGQGDWHLRVTSMLDIEILSYVRTADGFVTAMHDTAPGEDGTYRVAFFNPGSNANQASRLRLVNFGTEDAAASIAGTDDANASPGVPVEIEVPAGRAVEITAADLERRGLGDGTGKWRLAVTADQPLEVMSLLESPTGHLTNLSTVPGTR